MVVILVLRASNAGAGACVRAGRCRVRNVFAHQPPAPLGAPVGCMGLLACHTTRRPSPRLPGRDDRVGATHADEHATLPLDSIIRPRS